MAEPVMALLAMASAALILVIVPLAATAYAQYRGRRNVRCPATGLAAEIRIDALHAARTAVMGPAELRVRACSEWPGRRGCDHECLADM